jgi:DNA-binding transcriptional MocR family regulator
MTRRAAPMSRTTLELDHASAVPLYRQIYERLRRAVLDGRLKTGERLPSTRELASELGISRNTVFIAYEQLLAEGFSPRDMDTAHYTACTVFPTRLIHLPALRGLSTVARSDSHPYWPDTRRSLYGGPGDAAWIEDPGYPGARGVLLGVGAQVIPVPVDNEGLDVAAGMKRCAQARLAFVTPSHQFPLGGTMSLSRRLALLGWAKRANAWIIEDDYDSEYRFAGRPLAALQSLDSANRVIYLGTFSKVLFPALRLGYLVVPPGLVDAFIAVRRFIDMHVPVLEQAALADFIVEGHFSRHIRRTRRLYAARRAALVEALGKELGSVLEIQGSEAGMHLVGRLPPGVDDRAAAKRVRSSGIDVAAVSPFGMEPMSRGGLLLGYAPVAEQAIREGVSKLAVVLRSMKIGVEKD